MPIPVQSDDYAPDSSTTGVLTIGATLIGSASAGTDHDWFKVELAAGTTYQFQLNVNGMAAGYYPDFNFSSLALRDGQGLELASSTTYAMYGQVYVQYTPVSSGTYYVDVLSSERNGNYGLSMSTPAPDAVPSQGNGAPQLALNVAVSGLFDYAGDRDWYRFHAEPGQHLQFRTPRGTAADAMSASAVDFYDLNGKPLKYSYPFEPDMAGDYYVSLQGNDKGSYTLLMSALADDYSGTPATTGKLLPGGAAQSGKIDYSYDTDAFHMPVEAGKVYTVKVSGIDADKHHLDYRVSDGSGDRYLEVNKATGGFSFKADSTGDVVISLASYAEKPPAESGAYTVQAEAGILDEYGDDAAHAAAAALGQPVSGALQGSDVDVFKVELQAGVTYAVEAAGMPAAGTPAARQPLLLLKDATGKEVASGRYSEASGKFNVTPTADGTYFGYVSGTDLPYTFKVVAMPDDYTGNSHTAGILQVGGSARGTLESMADVDWLAVDLTAGVTYWFTSVSFDSTEFFKRSGPSLKLVDSQGNTLAEQPTGLNSDQVPTMNFVPQNSGTYYVRATPWSSWDNMPAHYGVSARIGEQDDYGTTRATAGTLVADVPAKGRLELAQDADMFRFTAAEGKAYVVELLDSKGIAMNLPVTVTDDQGATGLLRKSGPNYRETTLFEPKSAGEYYVTVTGDRGTTGDYTLRLKPVGGDTIPASNATKAVLQTGAPVQGMLESKYDADWYKVALQNGHTYAVELQGRLSGNGSLEAQALGLGIVDAYGYGSSVDGPSSYRGYSEPAMLFKADRNGDYFVKVDGGAAADGSYTVQVTDITNDRKGPELTAVSHGGDARLELFDTITLTFDERVKIDGRSIELKGPQGVVSVNGVTTVYSDKQFAAGNKLVLDPTYRLDPGMTYALALKPGTITDMAGNPYSGPMSFSFTTRPLLDTGTDGNDYLNGAGKAGALDGGAGTDIAFLPGRTTDFTITGAGGGKFAIASRYMSPVINAALDNVERLMFAGSGFGVALDIEGTAGKAYRLYQAAFNRTPDETGVGYWMAQLDKGMALNDAARYFMAGAEFQKLYGANPTDASFVDLLYSNVLHRAPDASGAAYWTGVLHDGLPREQALAYFSESQENHDAVAKLIANGFSYIPYG
ncbi:hypothetical protein GCM10027277_02580 [Pseudoduganella ginsengisoli]|uniref:DUF4214 domain-containing protein n=1 Tax=Pseudoduganella ginsengisoli TaxID=1462440 RepID=A0A6L6Q5L0_9BURK|nr:DUF4214 domain-containing protein [Pseudoduganella ginsengisoli]MTW04694.1 DUF4214 domain-containing protein [Pseudoduganella ginsengisoli]